jgi:hypothetical protein
VPPDDTTLTMRDAVTRRVQLRWTSIDVDPSAVASVSTTPRQSNTSPASIFPETRLLLSPNQEHLHLSPFLEQLHPSPIRDQLCRSPPQTRSTLLPAPDRTHSKVMKNVHGKSLPQQRKMSSKATNGKKPLKELVANPKLLSSMTHANPKFVMGKLMLTVDTLRKAGQPCLKLHNYYINNYKLGQNIIMSYRDRHFLVGDSFFLISFSDLYNLFNLNALDVSLMRCFTS